MMKEKIENRINENILINNSKKYENNSWIKEIIKVQKSTTASVVCLNKVFV